MLKRKWLASVIVTLILSGCAATYESAEEAYQDGDYAKARQIQDKLIPLHQVMFAEPSPAGAKYAMSLLNKCQPDCRLPVTELSETTKTRIKNVMQSLELI